MNNPDILMVAYVYPGSDREQWQDCTRKIREYLHDKLGGPGIRMSHASDNSHSGIVDKIVVGYSGQFGCYEQALAKSGYDNIRKLIFYPILGKVIELKK